MAWRFRKSIKLGPLRLNLSKSGVGTSIGVRGFLKVAEIALDHGGAASRQLIPKSCREPVQNESEGLGIRHRRLDRECQDEPLRGAAQVERIRLFATRPRRQPP